MPQKSSIQSRSWGTRFDTLPISPLMPTKPHSPQDPTRLYAQHGRKDDKMPHDASIFVGRSVFHATYYVHIILYPVQSPCQHRPV